ncbi:MAG: DUF4342 domain-containing protein [bacterium]
MEDKQRQEYRLNGNELVNKFKEILQEGNARRIIIKNEKGDSILEIPVTIGVVGVLLAPYLAAVGAIAAFVTNCTLVVEKNVKKESDAEEKNESTEE